MDTNIKITSKNNTKELLKAQTHIWSQIFNYLNSMAFKCAIQLQIFDTIHNHGKPMTLNELTASLSLHPTKVTSLYRILRVLVHSNFLSESYSPNNNGKAVAYYDLTINSQLVLQNHPMTLAPFVLAMLNPTKTDPAHQIATWFRNKDVSPFHTSHGCGLWEYAGSVSTFNDYFNQAMASDAKFVGDILMKSGEFRGLFDGVGSLVDVGGGTGTLARIIADGFPGVKCSVFDLPHVVEGLQSNGLELDFVGGDMFVAVPPAHVVLLKWIMHDWNDENCIKILEKCKEAIPSKEQGGKVIIIDAVVDTLNDDISSSQLKFDIQMLTVTIGGKERTEEEWKDLFVKAGYINYEIYHILGSRSVIVVYPK
ncbi:hypothetical protein vseg_017626 [Gypsophila vaccaria]